MKKMKMFTKLSLAVMLLLAITSKTQAQSIHPFMPDRYVFNIDSLKGFDEESAKQAAMGIGAFGDEFKTFMFFAKSEYIKAKYNIPLYSPTANAKGVNPNVLVAACVNEDFEDAGLTNPSPGTVAIVTAAGINGWTSSRGVNSGGTGSCLLTTCCPSLPNAIWVISPPAGGLIDALIGPTYPIYSVFGSGGPNGGDPWNVGLGVDTMRGNWFVKLNQQTPGADLHKISKTINVTPANALFQFAFISVLEGAHCCCDNTGISLKVKDCSNNVLACPQFTASTPNGAGCAGGVGTPCLSPGNTTSYTVCPLNAGWRYNKWKLTTLDLTSYIGSCVTIDVVAIDCPYTGHAGYVYFDAQCLPMTIIGNGTGFPAGTPQITLPTCGAGSTATVSAPPNTGPYQWTGPVGFIPTTNQTFTTAITGNYTLVMTPPGACLPIVRTVSVIITPAPNLSVPCATQIACGQPTNAVCLAMASGIPNPTITPNYVVSWAPCAPTGTIGQTAGTGTYSGLCAGINTITITDAVGCKNTTTINIAASPPVPSFSLSAPMGTVVGCAPPTISLTAVNTSTLTNMTYTWTSIVTGTATGTTINATAPGGSNTYTVTGNDLTVGGCPVTHTIAISQNTTVPIVNVNPINGNLTCNGAPANFTATCLPFSLNIWGSWYDPSGNPIGALSNSPILLSATFPGVYVATFTNIANGCVGSNSVSVTSSTTIPTMTVNAVNGYTITCYQPCLVMNITSSATLAPKGYTWTNMATSASVTPANGGYTICVPGNYLAQFHDGNFCTVSQMITVSIDTVRPSPSCLTGLASNGFTLNCYNSCITPTAISNPLLPISNYSWTTPPNLTVASNTVPICLANITSSTTPTNFTVLAQGANGCVGRAKIPFYKDIFVPLYTAVFTPSAITCGNPAVAMSPQTTFTTPTSFTFTSPPPTTTANVSGALFSIPGPYTLHYQNTLNGCTANAYTTVPINATPPATVFLQPVMIPCGSNTIGLTAGTTSNLTTYQYTWDPPIGAGMTGPNSYSNNVNMIGDYGVTITNTVNGCVSTNSVNVSLGALSVGFTANPDHGFSPLNVAFTNTTQLGAMGTGTVYTWWGYGNGSTYTATNTSTLGTPNGSATYPTAGSYTVLLVVTQSVTVAGNTTGCTGTATMVINVDLPSKLDIPNVFTPNGDGINDVFMLQTTNLTDISCVIFDRWGVKMYDVTSTTGNIAWDGKTLFGQPAPSGTFFYIIKATGKDNAAYEYKGTVSLYR